MKIEKIKIKNFRSIKEETLFFPENGLIALIGANNAGKSNFLRAIDFVLGDAWLMEGKLEDYDFYCGDRNNDISIEIFFNDEYIEKIVLSKDIERGEYKLRYKAKNNDGLRWLSNEIKDRFPRTYLSAERTISRDLSITKWSLMGKVAKSFNKSLSTDQKSKLKEHFGKVKETFEGVDSFKNFEEDFEKFFDEMQSDSPYKLKVNFKPFTPNNYFKTINILAKDVNLENDLDLEELGDGAKNLVILALLRSYAKNFRNASGILAVEEPEIYLHPQARRHLFQILKEISRSNIQVIYTTHDSSFLDFPEFESVRKVYKVGAEGRQETKIKSLTSEELIEFAGKTGVSVKLTKENIVEFYRSLSNFRLTEAFFSRLIILVEGQTEELTLPIYLNGCGVDCDKLGISILSVEGKSQIPKYWRLFYKFEIPMILIFDGDKKKSNKTISECFDSNIDNMVSKIKTFDYKLFEKKEVFKQDTIIFEKDFETSLEDDAKKQGIKILDYEKQAKNFVVDSKGEPKQVLARWIALKLQEEKPDYKPSFMLKIKDLITEKLSR